MTSNRKLFSLKKPSRSFGTCIDSQNKIEKKKDLSSKKISLFTKKSKVNVPVTPVPEIVTTVSEPVNEKVLETYSLIEPYC